jgi:hypothetical protein
MNIVGLALSYKPKSSHELGAADIYCSNPHGLVMGVMPNENLPAEGLEPTRSCDHWILSPARLPIPPRRRWELETTNSKAKLKRFRPVVALLCEARQDGTGRPDCPPAFALAATKQAGATATADRLSGDPAVAREFREE